MTNYEQEPSIDSIDLNEVCEELKYYAQINQPQHKEQDKEPIFNLKNNSIDIVDRVNCEINQQRIKDISQKTNENMEVIVSKAIALYELTLREKSNGRKLAVVDENKLIDGKIIEI